MEPDTVVKDQFMMMTAANLFMRDTMAKEIKKIRKECGYYFFPGPLESLFWNRPLANVAITVTKPCRYEPV